MKPETLIPHAFKFRETEPKESGRYLIIRKDGKAHMEVWNGSGWAYNHNEIRWFYLPKIA